MHETALELCPCIRPFSFAHVLEPFSFARVEVNEVSSAETVYPRGALFDN
jgi:hypothetical protein